MKLFMFLRCLSVLLVCFGVGMYSVSMEQSSNFWARITVWPPGFTWKQHENLTNEAPCVGFMSFIPGYPYTSIHLARDQVLGLTCKSSFCQIM